MSFEPPAIRLLGYADRLTARPGESIGFHIASRLEGAFQARLVRVICSDPNPEGPGLQEEEVAADLASGYRADWQEMPRGSYMQVPGAEALGRHERLTLSATILPTLPGKGEQAVMTLRAADGRRLALSLDEDACLSLALSGGSVVALRIAGPLRAKRWLSCSAEIDFAIGRLALSYEELESLGEAASEELTAEDLGSAFEIAAVTVAALDSPARVGLFNGKIEAPCLSAGEELLAAWDFGQEIASFQTPDRGPLGLTGELVNRPLRGVTGASWDGEEMCWRHRPDHYAAVHFHDSDFGDAGWPETLRLTLPADLRSGLYALRLSGEGQKTPFPSWCRHRWGSARPTSA